MLRIYYGFAWEKKFHWGKKPPNEKTFKNSDFSKNREVNFFIVPMGTTCSSKRLVRELRNEVNT